MIVHLEQGQKSIERKTMASYLEIGDSRFRCALWTFKQ